MIEKEHYFSSEFHWAQWNERLKNLRAEMQELRITSIVLFALHFYILHQSRFESTVITLTLVVACVLWAFSYIYSILSRFSMMPRVDWMTYDIEREPDRESSAILAKELEYVSIALARRLRLVKYLITIALVYSIASLVIYLSAFSIGP